MTIALSDLESLAVGLLALVVANTIARHLPIISRLSVPVPVVGGILVAIITALLHKFSDTSIQFAGQLTDFFLLAFFTTVGLSAKFSALKAGGRPLVILCVVTVILLVVQNIVGLLMVSAFGAHPFYGLLIGSISFVGGPGTAAAWAKEAQAMGLDTRARGRRRRGDLAVIVGAIVAGPITGWLIRRRNLQGPGRRNASELGRAGERRAGARAADCDHHAVLLLIVVAILAGDAVNAWARREGMVLPGFLTAMLAGVAITNVSDAIGAKIDLSRSSAPEKSHCKPSSPCTS